MLLKLISLKKEEHASDHITLLQEGIFKHIISKKKFFKIKKNPGKNLRRSTVIVKCLFFLGAFCSNAL